MPNSASRSIFNWTAAGLLAVGGLSGSPAAQQPPGGAPPSPEAAHHALVRTYCLSCHNNRLQSGGLDLDATNKATLNDHRDVWEKVVRKLRARQMPPVGAPRPDEIAYNAALASLETSLDSLAAAAPNPGRTATFRRLTRTEYRNAVHDLLALEPDVDALLPSDSSSYGFDNVTVGNLSPTLLERYVSAAEKISRLAVGRAGQSVNGSTVRIQPDLTQEEHVEGLPLGTRGGALVHHTFPVDGHYEITIRLARDRNEHIEGLSEPHDLELLLDGARVQAFTVTPPALQKEHELSYQPSQDTLDAHLKIRVPVTAGPHALGVTFPKKPTVLLETARQPYQAHFNYYRHPRLQPAVYEISIVGPYEAVGAGDTPSRRRVFVCRPPRPDENRGAGAPGVTSGAGRRAPAEQDRGAGAPGVIEDVCAKRILSTVMRRAYRRPVTDGDLAKPFELYRAARAAAGNQAGFEAGIEMGLAAVLVSPEFLFRVEQDPAGVPAGTPYRISDLELASRLSFFLWSSIPDDELLDAAARGELGTPAVLERQVRRMLADQRSRNLVTNFASQWLHLRNLDAISPDMRLFPDFDDNLRQAFRRETELLIDSVMREDRSVLDLLRANYTFVNERLARHYGIPNVYGSRFRRITFDNDRGTGAPGVVNDRGTGAPGVVEARGAAASGVDNARRAAGSGVDNDRRAAAPGMTNTRGGLLRHGSILLVTSYATRTSPVIRGKWVLDNLLGVPPPPPPPNVPALADAPTIAATVPMRERLAQHRANPVCANCHRQMDPVGFALENYDAVGRWRTVEAGVPIDASGTLFDGTAVNGIADLEAALLRRPELLVGTIAEKLLTFANGRGLEPDDAPAVRRILREAREQEYRFSSLVIGVVTSVPFRMRTAS